MFGCLAVEVPVGPKSAVCSDRTDRARESTTRVMNCDGAGVNTTASTPTTTATATLPTATLPTSVWTSTAALSSPAFTCFQNSSTTTTTSTIVPSPDSRAEELRSLPTLTPPQSNSWNLNLLLSSSTSGSSSSQSLEQRQPPPLRSSLSVAQLLAGRFGEGDGNPNSNPNDPNGNNNNPFPSLSVSSASYGFSTGMSNYSSNQQLQQQQTRLSGSAALDPTNLTTLPSFPSTSLPPPIASNLFSAPSGPSSLRLPPPGELISSGSAPPSSSPSSPRTQLPGLQHPFLSGLTSPNPQSPFQPPQTQAQPHTSLQSLLSSAGPWNSLPLLGSPSLLRMTQAEEQKLPGWFPTPPTGLGTLPSPQQLLSASHLSSSLQTPFNPAPSVQATPSHPHLYSIPPQLQDRPVGGADSGSAAALTSIGSGSLGAGGGQTLASRLASLPLLTNASLIAAKTTVPMPVPPLLSLLSESMLYGLLPQTVVKDLLESNRRSVSSLSRKFKNRWVRSYLKTLISYLDFYYSANPQPDTEKLRVLLRNLQRELRKQSREFTLADRKSVV